jgi:hypothetical protein
MAQNGLMYGFLTTWNQWWFMRTNGQTLFISRVFPHDAGNPTVCQVLGRMLLQAMKSFRLEEDGDKKRRMKKKMDISLLPFFGKKSAFSHIKSSSSSDVKSSGEGSVQSTDQTTYENFSKFLKKISSDPELLQYFLLSLDLIYVGYGRSGSVFKAYVNLGNNKHIEVALKIADVLKHPNLEEELEFEALVYKKLNSLQGRCIPFLFFDSPLWFYRVSSDIICLLKQSHFLP